MEAERYGGTLGLCLLQPTPVICTPASYGGGRPKRGKCRPQPPIIATEKPPTAQNAYGPIGNASPVIPRPTPTDAATGILTTFHDILAATPISNLIWLLFWFTKKVTYLVYLFRLLN